MSRPLVPAGAALLILFLIMIPPDGAGRHFDPAQIALLGRSARFYRAAFIAGAIVSVAAGYLAAWMPGGPGFLVRSRH